VSRVAQSTANGAPAFPGAQGWGKNATGGRDANTNVLFVTSLEDSGPSTLREALMQSGPRIVVFKTGGVIDLKSSISFRAGDVTIAGQTAPGDGIILRNFPIRIGASNVIMRGIRVRNGDEAGPLGDLRDSIQVGRVARLTEETIRDVIIDHCSFGWSMDEMVEFWYGARNVTLSHNIFSEALWMSQHPYTVKGSPYAGNPGHGYAMLFSNGLCDKISLYHNLFAHNERRNPWIKDNARVEMVNNVIYNWGPKRRDCGTPQPMHRQRLRISSATITKPAPTRTRATKVLICFASLLPAASST
jgi:pectate lyase